MIRRIPLVCLLLSLTIEIRAADWPQWRGPDRTGISAETGLLAKWPEKGPQLVWTFKDAGLGFSAAAIRDGKLYTLGTRDDQEVVLALDAAKGTELWNAKIGPIFTFKGNVWGDGPRSTPTLDGNYLYALGGQGDLVCIDLEKKSEVWRKNLITDFDGVMMSEWGYSESPVVDGDLVFITPGGKKGTFLALNKKTGATVWQSAEITHKAPYSTAMPVDLHGVRQFVQLSYISDTEGGFVSGIRAKDGKVLWKEQIFKGHSYAAAPTPIVKDDLVYVTTGYGGGCHAFQIDKSFKAKELFSKKNQKSVKNTHGGMIRIGDHVFGHSEGLGWVCQEMKTGSVKWNERDQLNTKSGAITAADSKLYLYTEDGEAALLNASPEAFDKISSFKIPERSKLTQSRPTSRASMAWSHPVIANGHLILRDGEFIYCYDLRAQK